MKRLTTNYPDNNLDAALNLFYIKDFAMARITRTSGSTILSAKPQRFCCRTWTSQWMMMA